MDVIVALQVALGWVAALLLIHRLNVRRLRAQAGLASLRRLDWDALLQGLLPEPPSNEGPLAPPDPGLPRYLPDGAPTPECLVWPMAEAVHPRRAALVSLVSGTPLPDPRATFEAAGFSGGEVRWLCTLARLRSDPLGALEELEASPLASAAELYLREHLRLLHRTSLLNLELLTLGARQRLSVGITRFGESPALYFGRALAASLVGWNQIATDELARAVYFSQTSGFYLRAVLDTPWLEEARPELVLQCRKAWEARRSKERTSTDPGMRWS